MAASTARSVAPPMPTISGPAGSTRITSPSRSNSHGAIAPLGKRPARLTSSDGEILRAAVLNGLSACSTIRPIISLTSLQRVWRVLSDAWDAAGADDPDFVATVESRLRDLIGDEVEITGIDAVVRRRAVK